MVFTEAAALDVAPACGSVALCAGATLGWAVDWPDALTKAAPGGTTRGAAGAAPD
jgi:hypothetical protein